MDATHSCKQANRKTLKLTALADSQCLHVAHLSQGIPRMHDQTQREVKCISLTHRKKLNRKWLKGKLTFPRASIDAPDGETFQHTG